MPETTEVHDIMEEGALSLSAAARVLPRFNGQHPNPSTLWRWSRVGVKGIRLEYARLGQRIVTSKAALARFAKALAAADQVKLASGRAATAPTTRTQAQRQRAIAEAEAELAKAGI